MDALPIRRTARVLDVLVAVTFACNLIALPLVPGAVYVRFALDGGLARIQALLAYDVDDGLSALARTYWDVWQEPYTAALSLFLLVSGVCTACILWQGRRVLASILRGEPFSPDNAAALRKAARCSFLIAAAALVRLVSSVWYFRSPAPLVSYNALFVPIFAMAGLLLMVMSALFRQAAEMKAENDLTI